MPTPRSLTSAPHEDIDLQVVDGAWPTDLHGEVLFSSPQISGRTEYGIFDFGAMHRLSLRPGSRGAAPDELAWRARSIQSPAKRLFDAAPDLFAGGPIGYTSPFGSPNCANTAPLPWGDRLYATWDAGRPVELHPDTLEFVAEVGHVDTWGGPSMGGDTVLPMLLSTAHPVVDPERDCLWSAKLEPVIEPTFGMRPSVVRYDGNGTAVQHWPLEGVSFAGSIHTVSQTRDWVILSDSGNFKPDPGEIFGGARTVTVDEAVPVWLLRKDVLEATPSGRPVTPITLTMAPPSGHYYARYDDSDGISVVWEGMDLMDLAIYMKPDDLDVNGHAVDPAVVGLYNMAMAPETLVEVVFDPETGQVKEQGIFKADWAFNLQLSAMDWTLEGLSDPTLHHVAYQGCRPGRISDRAATLYADRIDRAAVAEDTPGALASFRRGSIDLVSRWEYPDVADLISSPTFVPRQSAPEVETSRYTNGDPGGHDGYVVLPVFNDDGFRVEVFDAANVGAGPIATARPAGGRCVPMLLHSAWMPTFTDLADADRLRFSDELNDARLQSVPEEHRGLVSRVAADLDGA
jgi:hypothetical protein